MMLSFVGISDAPLVRSPPEYPSSEPDVTVPPVGIAKAVLLARASATSVDSAA